MPTPTLRSSEPAQLGGLAALFVLDGPMDGDAFPAYVSQVLPMARALSAEEPGVHARLASPSNSPFSILPWRSAILGDELDAGERENPRRGCRRSLTYARRSPATVALRAACRRDGNSGSVQQTPPPTYSAAKPLNRDKPRNARGSIPRHFGREGSS